MRENLFYVTILKDPKYQTIGYSVIPYTVRDFQKGLGNYSGNEFDNNFFTKYIYDNQVPDYET